MSLFRKLYAPREVTTEPYQFKPGGVYVLEVDETKVDGDSVGYLLDYFDRNDITAHLIPTYGGTRAINPVEATTTKDKK